MLSTTLNTRRATVSLLAADLRNRDMITYSRGQVRVLTRKKLEAAACSCYSINDCINVVPLGVPV